MRRLVLLFYIVLGAFGLHQIDQRVIGSLKSGRWFKLICGASNQEITTIRNLCFLYTAAGVDCIDIAADKAVLTAAFDGIMVAQTLYNVPKPFIMLSINDGEDAHFRKAFFDPKQCPPDCSRPCERICPALAINHEGVFDDRCYGCGRCLNVCPYGLITEQHKITSRSNIKTLIEENPIIDAIEIHTNENHELQFHDLIQQIGNEMFQHLKLISISFPDFGDQETVQFLKNLQLILQSHDAWGKFQGVQIWQTDGNPMSGDILKIPSYRSFALAQNILQSQDLKSVIDFNAQKHFVQLSGGINDLSLKAAKEKQFSKLSGFGGYGLGGFVRKLFLDDLIRLNQGGNALIENYPEQCNRMLSQARYIVQLVKCVE